MLDKLKEAAGIFCSNETSTLGMLLALKQNNLAGSKKLVELRHVARTRGRLGSRLNTPSARRAKSQKMGREAVQALVATMKGETVHPVIDTGAAVVTKENLGTPEIQERLISIKR